MKLLARTAKIMLVVAFLVAPTFALAYTNPGKPTGFINDFTQTLSVEQKQTLENKLSAFEASTTNEISVAIIPSLGGDTIENYAVHLFSDGPDGRGHERTGRHEYFRPCNFSG